VGCLVFVFCFLVFHRAPVQQAGDSRYSMLLSENLLRHGDFTLERYSLPESDYRIQDIGGHRYYAFPVGTSILSVPFVAVMHLRGISAVRRDGTYDLKGELSLDLKLASLLMAGFASLVYFTARLLLPVRWSVAITLVSAFGTQVFSTTSRSMWSDTWGILLVGIAVFLLLRSSSTGERPNFFLLATLEGWAYIVRPTNSLVLAASVLYIAVTFRRYLWQFLLTLAGWLGLFVALSWMTFHKILPDYFAANRLQFPTPWMAFFGNLVSPSRGLLVYVPAVIAIGLMLAKYRRTIRFPALAALAGFIIVAHLFMLAGFVHWWGGFSYGARLTASLIPWFVLLAVLAADAAAHSTNGQSDRGAAWPMPLLVGGLCAASIAMNAVGAFSAEAQKWNTLPESIDLTPERLWSWERPQFLAPFIEPGGEFARLSDEGLRLGRLEARKYLGFGWSSDEEEFRWTDGRGDSSVRFSLSEGGAGILELDLRPYLAAGKVTEQRLAVRINRRELATFTLRKPEFAVYSVVVPKDVLVNNNTLRLFHPDAESPAAGGGGTDPRLLGVAVRTIRWRPLTP
jgi:hypothetical protein